VRYISLIYLHGSGVKMEIDIVPLVSSCSSSNFVGRKRVSDEFYDWLNSMTIMKQPKNQWVHIYGPHGSGKSSLLQKFKEMSIAERVQEIETQIQYFPEDFQEVLAKIFHRIDEKTPEWRSFLQRRTKAALAEFPDNFLQIVDEGQIDGLISELLKNFESVAAKLKESSTVIGIFMDDIDNNLKYKKVNHIELLTKLISSISKLSNEIFFVTTSGTPLSLSTDSNVMTLLEIDAFEVVDAELMIRRREKLDKDDREDITSASSRLPFDLALRTELFVRGHDYRILDIENLTALFGLNEEELKLFIKLATEDKNSFSLERLEDTFGKKLISQLIDRRFFASNGKDLTICSSSLWLLISSFFLPTDVRTELLLAVQSVSDRVNDGNLPSTKELNLVKTGIHQIRDTSLLFEISGKLIEIIDNALEHDIIYTAWEVLQLANAALEKTGDQEKLAEMNETFGQAFGKAGHEYYAAQSFIRAAELFQKIGSSWKISAETNYREAGLRYRKEAESMNLKTFHYAMRSMYAKSIRAFLAAEELGSVNSTRKNAMEVFREYPEHQNFIRGIGGIES